MTKFYGKYRGTVIDNEELTAGDGMRLGRILVQVPAVLGLNFSWAMPCVPYAGLGVGFYMIPPIDANVWVEFEGGEPSFPIWSGCFWGLGELPLAASLPTKKLVQTAGVTLLLDETPGEGGASITTLDPATLAPLTLQLSSTAIELSCIPASLQISAESVQMSLGAASINLTPASVSINDGALEVI